MNTSAKRILDGFRPYIRESNENLPRYVVPLVLMARLDAKLAATKQEVLNFARDCRGDNENPRLDRTSRYETRKAFKKSGQPYFNDCPFPLAEVTHDDEHLRERVEQYVNGYSKNVEQVLRNLEVIGLVENLQEMGTLYETLEHVENLTRDLSIDAVEDIEMAQIFDELLQVLAEETGGLAAETITPRDIVDLCVRILFAPHEQKLKQTSGTIRIYDPAAGTNGMLLAARDYLKNLAESYPRILIRGLEVRQNIHARGQGNLLMRGIDGAWDSGKGVLYQDTMLPGPHVSATKADYALSNPPYGESWSENEDRVRQEGRFSPGLPYVGDGQMLFMLEVLARLEEDGRAVVVSNASPLFVGGAESGPSEIRRHIFENDWLDTIVSLPKNIFYNTDITTYLWVFDKQKPSDREGRVRLINGGVLDAKDEPVLASKLPSSQQKKRYRFNEKHLSVLTGLVSKPESEIVEFTAGTDLSLTAAELVQCFDTEDFGYRRIKVHRPLRQVFSVDSERLDAFTADRSVKGFTDVKSEKAIREKRRYLDIVKEELSRLQKEGCKLDYDEFFDRLSSAVKSEDAVNRETKPLRTALIEHFGERHSSGKPVWASKSDEHPVADSELDDEENLPMTEDIDSYVEREVLPFVPDAWIDESWTRVGYEIPFTRYFYEYEPPRRFEDIKEDVKSLEDEIQGMLSEVLG